ncbi:hypothetical protein [Notoacmeibacter ruber]|uniref:Uncharacterized protein n=1 Tax=Notoacmeibacter ruber TaxID=2670375 RepID=A0A3L7JEL3_9HYPH|nr:hypothetical protein [Notoacmeibacter ruber]RLQ89116.1 hypothetical protein D8780_13560 [Notoacmeibacter ruber]
MDVQTQLRLSARRFDSEETILDALRELCEAGVDPDEMENQLVRLGPTDLDILSTVLSDLREVMAANDHKAPVSAAESTPSGQKRYGRFAASS